MMKAWVYILECQDGSYYTGGRGMFKNALQPTALAEERNIRAPIRRLESRM